MSSTSSTWQGGRGKKAGALRDAGFDMSIDGDGFTSIQYQNANNSVRVSDEFLAVADDDAGGTCSPAQTARSPRPCRPVT